MKKRRSNTRLHLSLLLTVILGGLLSVYIVLYRGESHNNISTESSETTSAAPTEDFVTQPVTELVTQETETETEPISLPTEWDTYSAADNLLSEQWSITLINQRFSLSEKYSPTLSPVIDGSSITVDSRVAEAYRRMYADALSTDIVLNPVTGYSSYHRQIEAYNDKVSSFVSQGMTSDEAENEAARRVGKPGCNESACGLSVGIGSVSNGFSSSEKYRWLLANAHNYGFVLRYPQDKTQITGMTFQPWLWRYVGVEVAKEMKENNLCLEEYLGITNQ